MTEEREDEAPSGDPEIDRNVEDLEHRGGKVEEAIRETKRDWEAKQSSESVPGAVDSDEPPPDE